MVRKVVLVRVRHVKEHCSILQRLRGLYVLDDALGRIVAGAVAVDANALAVCHVRRRVVARAACAEPPSTREALVPFKSRRLHVLVDVRKLRGCKPVTDPRPFVPKDRIVPIESIHHRRVKDRAELDIQPPVRSALVPPIQVVLNLIVIGES